MKRYLIILLAIPMMYSSCSDPEDSPSLDPISSTPEIVIHAMTPESINQFERVKFMLGYTDGDGNLGDEDPNVHALEVLDTRDSILHTFHVPPQSPVPNITISGVLEFDIENIILLDQNSTSEEVVFTIRLKDASGKWSNTVESPTLTISK